MEQEKNYVWRVYNLARAKGIVKRQGEFADMLSMNKATISMALNGSEKYLTDSLINRVRTWAAKVGLVDDTEGGGGGGQQPQPQKDGVYIPQQTLDLFTSQASSIDRLSGLVEKLTDMVDRLTEK